MGVLNRIEDLLVENNEKLDTLNASINNLAINLTVENVSVDNSKLEILLYSILRALNNQSAVELYEIIKSESGS